MYCAASEQGFEDLSGNIKTLTSKSKDIMNLSLACIVAAYTAEDKEPPIKSEDILYRATSKELTDLYLTVINLRAAWSRCLPSFQKKLKQESEGMTDEEKAEAQPPTTDTASS